MRATVERAFAPALADGPRIGAEVEMQVLAGGPASGSAPAAELSIEPGGQLELSLGPRRSVAGLVRDIEAGLRWVATTTEVALTGTHPHRSLAEAPLVRPTPRYLALQRLLDDAGPDGRRMMRLTASLQVCVDLLPGRAGVEQWWVANLAGPTLAATYANSPHVDGRPSLVPGNRTRIWQGLPQNRVGYDGRHLDLRDPVGAYAAFATAAERLGIPEAGDDGYHLGTLFPPVRPRGGYLELRFLDAQPANRIPEVLDTVWMLMYDEAVRREAYELLLPGLGSLWAQWGDAALGRSAYATDLADLLTIGERVPA